MSLKNNIFFFSHLSEEKEFFDIVLVLRSLRLIKLIGNIKRFRIIIDTIATIIPSLLTYAMLVLTIFYMFSMIGMEFFGKTIQSQSDGPVYNCQNDLLSNTDFAK